MGCTEPAIRWPGGQSCKEVLRFFRKGPPQDVVTEETVLTREIRTSLRDLARGAPHVPSREERADSRDSGLLETPVAEALHVFGIT